MIEFSVTLAEGAAVLAFSYLLGAFPSGFFVSRCRGVRIEELGSGNVGAANVARHVGLPFGALTLLLDVGKGALAVLVAQKYSLEVPAGCLAVLGHCCSIPHLLKGGKGVATTLGVLLLLQPMTALVGVLAYVLTALLFRIASLASLAGATFATAYAWFATPQWVENMALSALCMLIFMRHTKNIIRLINRQEPKIQLGYSLTTSKPSGPK